MSPFNKEIERVSRDFKREVTNSSLSSGGTKTVDIHLGNNALSRKRVDIPLAELMETHTLVLGRTGMGKSYLLEMLARAIVQAGYGLIFLDGKGDLFDNLQKFSASQGLESKSVLVDPTDKNQSVGINYLELFGETSPTALAELVLEGLMKAFKEDTEPKRWLEEWGPVSLQPLIEGGFTLLELFKFTSLDDPRFRNALLSKLETGFYREKWREFVQTFKPHEQANILNVVRTRASRFWTAEPLKYIFGQTKTTINWLKLMSEAGILLANLGRGPNMTEKDASFIGTAIVHQLLTNAPLRPKGQRRPVFLMVDEFQKFVCNDFADALSRLRGFGIYLILSCQHLSQLFEENKQVHDSVMVNCGNKFVFSISRKDGEEMALELFTGYIHQDRIKDEILQWKFRPVETTREIVSEGDTWLRNISSGSGLTSGISIDSQGDILISSSSTTASNALANASGGSRTVARVPWYEYEQYQEVTSRAFYTPDQIIERYIAWVVNQDPRHLQMKLGSKKPIPMITADLKETRVLPSHVKEFRDKVFKKTALPIPELEKEIQGRVNGFLTDNEGSQKTKYPESFRVPKKSKQPKD